MAATLGARRSGVGQQLEGSSSLELVKRVLITGGSRGLGLAICRRLLVEGWHVVTASRSLSAELRELFEANAPKLEHHVADFSDHRAILPLAQQAKVLDGLDAFVANAGVGTEGLLTLTSDKAIEESVRVNLLAPVLLAREVIKGMLVRGGSLIFISSVAARNGLAGLAAYSAAKGGLISFSRSIAREYGERGIRSNCILPGFLETEMSQSLSAADRERVIRRTALKRLGGVDDVTGCVSFLLSNEARYITGAEFVVDGGFVA